MRCLPLGLCLALAVGSIAVSANADVGSRARVQNDGTLLINGKTVHLFGIYIPTIERTCRTNFLPTKCAPRAVLRSCRESRRFRSGACED